MKKSSDPARKPYGAPQLKRWGTVSDMTRAGYTNEGNDTKIGPQGYEGTANAYGIGKKPIKKPIGPIFKPTN